MRRDQGLTLCQTQQVPASSKMDPLLAKAEPPSVAAGVSVVRYLRKGKKSCKAALRDRSEKNVRETTLQTPRSVKKEGRRCSRHRSRYSLAAHREDYVEADCPAAACGEDHSEEGISLHPVEYHAGANIHTAAHAGPRARAGGYALKEAAVHGEPMQE